METIQLESSWECTNNIHDNINRSTLTFIRNENCKTKFCEIKAQSKQVNSNIHIKRFQYKGNAKHIEILDSKGYVCTKKGIKENEDMFLLESELNITSPFVIFRFILSNDNLKIETFKLDIDKDSIVNEITPIPSIDPSTKSNKENDILKMINDMENRLYEKIMKEINTLTSNIMSRIERLESKVFSDDKSQQ